MGQRIEQIVADAGVRQASAQLEVQLPRHREATEYAWQPSDQQGARSGLVQARARSSRSVPRRKSDRRRVQGRRGSMALAAGRHQPTFSAAREGTGAHGEAIVLRLSKLRLSRAVSCEKFLAGVSTRSRRIRIPAYAVQPEFRR